MEEENIIWTDMSKMAVPAKTTVGTVTEACKLKPYPSLYEELKDKCNPERYMSPYDKEKVDAANELYNQLLGMQEAGEEAMCVFRGQAMQRLEIRVSTQVLYEKLLSYCNPKNFMHPYDFDAVQAANRYYPLVEEYRNDVCRLEALNAEIIRDGILKGYFDEREEEAKKQREEERKREKKENSVMLVLGIMVIVISVVIAVVKAVVMGLG